MCEREDVWQQPQKIHEGESLRKRKEGRLVLRDVMIIVIIIIMIIKIIIIWKYKKVEKCYIFQLN